MISNMKHFFSSFTVCLVLFICGCSHSPSATDVAMLKSLEKKYTNFDFALTDEFYLQVTLRSDISVSEDELIEIYKAFFFEQTNANVRNTTFVYLNFYDSRGKFQYQLAFDPKKNAFVKSGSEYY